MHQKEPPRLRWGPVGGGGGWGGDGVGVPDLALCLQICLVPDQHDGEVISVLDSEDLREELAHLVETADEARGPDSCSPPAPPPPAPHPPITLTSAGR